MSYDYIIHTQPCPHCGTDITDWKTKDYFGFCRTYPVTYLANNSEIYGVCPGCNKLVTFWVRHVTPPVLAFEFHDDDDWDDEDDEIDEELLSIF